MAIQAEEMESRNQLPQPQQPTEGTTFVRTCFNFINNLSGIGILSTPYALSEGGWFSLILLFLVASLCCYTGLLLKRCMNKDPVIRSYPDIGEKAFGYKGRTLITILMCVQLYLMAVEFLILEGDNLNKLFPNMSFKVVGLKIAGKQAFVILTAILILPTTWLRSLGILAYVSVGGVLASIVLVGCVLWVGAFDGVGFHEGDVMLNWRGLPTVISMFVFCFSAHGALPTLCNSMKDRNQFSKVLLVSFMTATIINGSMAVLGYLMYGQYLMSQVTLNLPTKKISAKIAIYTTLVNPLTKYALCTTPLTKFIDETFRLDNKRSVSILMRTGMVISTSVVALTVPYFSCVMAFTGAFLCVAVSILLPCICYMKINKAARSFGLQLVIIVVILIAGVFVAVVGTYTSLKNIINHL